jgi:two-component system response regulator AtoC
VRLGAYDYLTKPFSLGQLDVIIERVSERNALEAENRQLARRVGDRESSESRGSVTERLDAIDARLSRIESLLERITAKPPRF